MVVFSGQAMLLATVILPALAQQTSLSSGPKQWTTFSRPINRVAVIGAGPAGLQAAAHLLDANLTVRLFEKAPSPGGNWFYTEEIPVREEYPGTKYTAPEPQPAEFPATRLDERWREHWQPRPVWHNLRTNSPAALTRLPGVHHSPDSPWLVSTHDLERHVRAFASLHGLNTNDKPLSPSHIPITSYLTRVEAIEKSNDTWTLTLRRLQWLPESHRLRADWWIETFDAVVAKIPAIRGIGNWSTATENRQYPMIHAQSFRHPERYSGKTVLIVGASISATHISRTIAPFAHRVLASTRANKYRDGYGLDILFSFAEKTEIVPEIASFEPLANNDEGIRAGRITLVNGTVIHGIDEIILATGYLTNTFLPDLVNPRRLDNLHWTGHYIHDPTLAYMLTGRPWIHGGYQGYAFAKVWTGKARLPSREQMWRDYRSKKYQFGMPLDILLQEALNKQYIAWLNNESLELGGQFVEPVPLETREIWSYFLNAHYKKDYLPHENWTRFDNLPFSEWPKPRSPDGEYKVVSW
ncbi:FAD/NAD-P-binding domain-containing protein [Mycena olivaceomarginata]|nr:FAD/NAD-P-binding domain-containing protein [Mycena olivaceomarginata]